MATKKRWADQLMMSLFQKETSYDGGVTMSDATACSMKGYSAETTWPDVVQSDKEEVTGTEHGTDQEIIEQRVNIAYKEPKAKPNSVAGLAALAMGSVAALQDGALTAYRHLITPVSMGTDLPSIQVEEEAGGVQYEYTGVKCGRFKLSGEAGGLLALEADLVGSGTRSTSSTSFASTISESWLKLNQCTVYMESGDDISITAAASIVQETQDISSGNPSNLGTRLTGFNFEWNNNIEGQPGFGGGGVLQNIDYGRRSIALDFTMHFAGQADLNYFINQNPMAIEFDLAGAVIATEGAMKYGLQLIIPRYKLKEPPLPQGGVGERLTAKFACEVFDDGTNNAAILAVYNAIAEYLAAAA